MDRVRDDDAGIARAAAHLREGGLVVFPTETFYGLAADPWQPAAVARLVALKGRAGGHALPLLAGEREQVARAAPGWEAAPRLACAAERFWPGPLAIVSPGAADLAPGVRAADGTVAIRWTSHAVAAALARAVDRPLVATSANRSGEPPQTDPLAAAAALGDGDDLLLLDGGPTAGGRPSTLVAERDGRLAVLRDGAVPAGEVVQAAG
jgi:L-threonylcarbamoyladenylate synthase